MSDAADNPYAAPVTSGGGADLEASLVADFDSWPKWARPYASCAPRARWAVALLAAYGLLMLVSMALESVQVGFVLGADFLLGLREGAIDGLNMAYFASGLVDFVLLTATGVAWCMWQHRAYCNLPALRGGPWQTSPGWSVGCWFIPIVNLFRPYQAVRDLWRQSHPATLGVDPQVVRASPVPALLPWWWALWIGGNLVGQVAARFALGLDEGSPRGAWLISGAMNFGVSLVDLAGALLAIRIVRGVTLLQAARWERVDAAGASSTSDAVRPVAEPI